MSSSPTTVMVVEDSVPTRARIRETLEQHGFEVVAAVRSHEEALAPGADPDVAVVDLRLGGKSGIEVIRDLTARGVKVVVYTAAEDREALSAALHAGAAGIALKAEPADELPRAVRTVAEGGEYVAAGVPEILTSAGGGRLSPREREVLFLLATGLSNDEVASELGLSPQTTKTQLKTAMRKLGARSRVEAVAIASAEGEITLP